MARHPPAKDILLRNSVWKCLKTTQPLILYFVAVMFSQMFPTVFKQREVLMCTPATGAFDQLVDTSRIGTLVKTYHNTN